ncbi:MAG: hypothetical protein R3F03_14770 [Opitutaceae bacterium]
MSNAAIITHIRGELEAFERRERTADQLETILHGRFEALEGVPYADLKTLHHFEYRLVTAQFSDDDPSIESKEVVLADSRAMLDALEKEANKSVQTRTTSGPV